MDTDSKPGPLPISSISPSTESNKACLDSKKEIILSKAMSMATGQCAPNGVELVILGPPVPQKRPRFAHMRKQHVLRVFDPNATNKINAKIQLREAWREHHKLTGEVMLKLTYFMKMPRPRSKKSQDSLVGTRHTTKPDLDNLVKFTCDCLTGIVIRDDSQISSILAKKVYAKTPHTQITIYSSELEELGESLFYTAWDVDDEKN